MIHDLALAVVSAIGAGGLGAAVMLVVAVRRVKPEFPPPGQAQREP